MRVLHIAYQQLRRYGHTRVSWAQKLTHGLIKNDHNVLVFSDRDVAAFEAPLGIRDLGKNKANRRLLETVESFQPDLVIAGHCDMISNETLHSIRAMRPEIAIAHCNNDPLFVPSNDQRLRHRAEVADAVFVSTGSRELARYDDASARFYHMPNPVDPAVETLDNSSAENLPIDLLFCSNSTNLSKRLELVAGLREEIGDELNFKTYGSFGEPPVWGRDYDHALSQTRMGLNLNRQEGLHWYSSARMAQLGGNGILVLTHSGASFDTLFPEQTLVYFSEPTELTAKVREFHHDDAQLRHYAARTRDFFHREINNKLYAQFIVEASTGQAFSHAYVWTNEPAAKGVR